MKKNQQNADINLLKEITILGYSGRYLALLFETLTSNSFKGKINIIINEKEKRAVAPFETNIPFEEFYYDVLPSPPGKKYTYSSNKPSTKKFLFEFYKNIWGIKRNEFINLIHSSSVLASTVDMGLGLQMEALSVVSSYTKIGFCVNIGRNCSIGHHNILNDFCSVYLGANLAGFVEIGEGATIGPGTTIFSEVKIGNNTVIGGGSVVTKDIPSNVLAYGNPCRIIKELN